MRGQIEETRLVFRELFPCFNHESLSDSVDYFAHSSSCRRKLGGLHSSSRSNTEDISLCSDSRNLYAIFCRSQEPQLAKHTTFVTAAASPREGAVSRKTRLGVITSVRKAFRVPRARVVVRGSLVPADVSG